MALHQNLHDATGKNATKDFLDAHPPTRNWQPQSAVVECKKPGEEQTSKFTFDSARRATRLRQSIRTALEQSGTDKLHVGSLERKALDLLQRLWVQIDRPIG